MAAWTAFEEAYTHGQERHDHLQSALAAAGAVLLIDACYGDFRSLHTWHDRLIRSAAQVAVPPDADWELVVGAACALAAGHGLHGSSARFSDSKRMLGLLGQGSDPDCALNAASAMIAFLDAARRDGDATLVEVAAQHFEDNAGPWSRGNWYSIRGQHALFYQRLDEAAELLARAASIARDEAIIPLAKMTAIMQVRLAIARGDHAAVPRLLAQCEPIDDELEPMWRAVVTQLQSLELLCTGRYNDALHCAHRAIAFARRAEAPADEAAQMVVLEAYCLMAIGDGASAGLKFRHAAAQTSGQQARVVSLLALFAEADVALECGDRELGRTLLGSALAEVRTLEYGAFFWPLPGIAARLCGHALALEVEPEYVRSIVRQRKLPPPSRAPSAWPWTIVIRALGRFDVVIEGEALRPAGKGQAKPLALLRCIVAFGGSAVSIDHITQLLWRGEGREGAKSAFAVTLHRLRHLLGQAHLITVTNGRITLDPERIWIDHRALRALLDSIDTATQLDRVGADVDALVALYAGPLLDDDPAAWTHAATKQLRARVDATLARCAMSMTPSQRGAALARALAADPELLLTAGVVAAQVER